MDWKRVIIMLLRIPHPQYDAPNCCYLVCGYSNQNGVGKHLYLMEISFVAFIIFFNTILEQDDSLISFIGLLSTSRV